MSGPRSSGGFVVDSAEPPRDKRRVAFCIGAAFVCVGLSILTRVLSSLRGLPEYVPVGLDALAFMALLPIVGGEMRRRAWKRLRPWLERTLWEILFGNGGGRSGDQRPDD
ncbi:hypothetical protein [Amycolatopsis sp. NPDC003861]